MIVSISGGMVSMESSDEAKVALLIKSALPIDDIDEIFGVSPCFVVVWVNLSERPDLRILGEQGTLAGGFSLCTWFAVYPGKRNMLLGLRVEMRQPVQFVLSLVFDVKKYSRQ